MELEWTGTQQLRFLVESIPVGVALGVVFNVVNGVCRIRRNGIKTFLFDVVFAVISAIITFFAALVIMDGQLHPILFIGLLFGFVVLHVAVGRFIAKAVFHMGVFCITVGEKGAACMNAAGQRLRRFMGREFRARRILPLDNGKTAKSRGFLRKKT